MITLGKTDRSHAQAIFDIRRLAIRDQCRSVYTPEEIDVWTSGELTERFTAMVEMYGYLIWNDQLAVASGMINLASRKLDAIFVRPSHMRRGLGKQMIEHLEGLARAAGLKELNLEATPNAVEFYRSCGFVGDQVVDYVTRSGLRLDSVVMVKAL